MPDIKVKRKSRILWIKPACWKSCFHWYVRGIIISALQDFQSLSIADAEDYGKYRNQFSVIHISFNELGGMCSSYEEYVGKIERRLVRDLKNEYPEMEIEENADAADVLLELYAADENARFIFVLDEWDFIFHQNFITEKNKREYLAFLRNLLKDRPYVLLAYMTGILPIAKYSSGSELNMFSEFTLAAEERFSEYFGFTEKEVDMLFARYEKQNRKSPQVTRAGLKKWYDEIFYYIRNNVDAVKDDLAVMISGGSVPARVREYAATSQELKTKEEILYAMVVYGFLSYENGEVSIPNKEVGELLVGIGYDKKTKKHRCEVEEVFQTV